MVTVRVQEFAGQFLSLVTVTESDGTQREMYIPKPILDLIKANIPSMNITNMLARASDNTYQLS